MILLLDFGGVCIKTPFEMLREVEAIADLPSGSLDWTGPFDPSADPLWQELLAERLTERGYWESRAREIGRLLGRSDFATSQYMELFAAAGESILMRQEALEVVAAVTGTGTQVAVLTNDLRAFHGEKWLATWRFFTMVDPVVDASLTGVLKPDPGAYRLALQALGDPDPAEVVFVDDQPANAAGGVAAGLRTIHFDVTRAESEWKDIAAIFGC